MKQVLIVEDDRELSTVLQLYLEKNGFPCLIAKDGEEGLNKAKNESPDLMILDVVMPGMSGFEVYKALKINPQTRNIPVIILTARKLMEDSFKVLGVDEFLDKPAEPELLLTTIRKLLRVEEVAVQDPFADQKKIVITGTYEKLLEQMAEKARTLKLRPILISGDLDLSYKCVEFAPDIVVLELASRGKQSASEVVAVLKSLEQLKKCPIILYSYYNVSELEDEETRRRIMNHEHYKEQCLKAGAAEYMGRYNENVFANTLRKYL